MNVYVDSIMTDGVQAWTNGAYYYYPSHTQSGIPDGTPFWSMAQHPPGYGTFTVTALQDGTLYFWSEDAAVWGAGRDGGFATTYSHLATGGTLTYFYYDNSFSQTLATYSMPMVAGQTFTVQWPTSNYYAASFLGGFGFGAAPSPTPSPASAAGDPHLQNVHGERFDLMKPGKHVLISIPRGASTEDALLRVEARASKLGGQCEDIYFTELNITGYWASVTQAGGYHFLAQQETEGTGKWVAMGKVELKVVHGHTGSGTQYLNFYIKHLGRTGLVVGGLLGEEDHSDVSTPPSGCVQHMSLGKPRARADGSGSVATAVAMAISA